MNNDGYYYLVGSRERIITKIDSDDYRFMNVSPFFTNLSMSSGTTIYYPEKEIQEFLTDDLCSADMSLLCVHGHATINPTTDSVAYVTWLQCPTHFDTLDEAKDALKTIHKRISNEEVYNYYGFFIKECVCDVEEIPEGFTRVIQYNDGEWTEKFI